MKKLVFLLIFGLITSTIFAQVTVRPGVKLGTNFSTITNTDLDYKVGLQAGAFATVRLADLYALQPEILYSSQGGKSKNTGQDDIDIKYFSILITNKFFVIPDNGFHLLVGPAFDFSIGDSIGDLYESPEYNPFDIALFAGVGYAFDFGLIIETRFKHGLLNIDLFSDNNDERLNVGANILNSVFQVATAYKFDF